MQKVIGLILLLACAATVAQPYEDENMQRGAAAAKRGDWESAANQFALAINDADLAREGPAVRAAAHVEYGRALGVLCQYDEAEKYLLLGKSIGDAGKGPRFFAAYELGSFQLARKKYPAATMLLAEAVAAAPKESPHPAALADAHEKYARALTEAGQPDAAAAQRQAAAKIREANPKARPAGVVAPYGARCP